MTALEPAAPVALPGTLPRDPRERLAALFDPGTLQVPPAGQDNAAGSRRGRA